MGILPDGRVNAASLCSWNLLMDMFGISSKMKFTRAWPRLPKPVRGEYLTTRAPANERATSRAARISECESC